MRARIFIRLITALLTIGPAAALADGVEDFYRGREVRIVVGFGPGGGYDLYARTIARHIGRYIPGSPTIVVQNMDGAGSRTATNWLYNVAPRDGSVIGTVSQGTPMDEVRKQDGVRLLGVGDLKSKLTISVYSASAGARKAVEAAGGSLTEARPVKAETAEA